MISVQNITGGYANQFLVKDISFETKKGELLGIIGPNGSGKTTLLKMLSGVHKPASGNIFIKGQHISSYNTKELAKVMAVLSQHFNDSFSYTVKDTVSLGRYAHQKGWFQALSEKDEQIIAEAMELTGISRYANHNIQHLSGGERQRVFLAQALAQEPEILLLDEPTNHLDLSFQKELLDLLKSLTKKQGLTVISIFHDLNLAGLYCDRLLLMNSGCLIKDDVPHGVLKEEIISSVYETEIKKQSHPFVPAPQMVLHSDVMISEKAESTIGLEHIAIEPGHILIKAPLFLKTISTGVIGSGLGWHRHFIIWQKGSRAEMEAYLLKSGYEIEETAGIIADAGGISYGLYEEKSFSILVAVTAGMDAGNSKSEAINMWIFVNGTLSEEVFIQSIMAAAEAKVKALGMDKGITAGILIAATQEGEVLETASQASPLGKLMNKGVYECISEAMAKYVKGKGD